VERVAVDRPVVAQGLPPLIESTAIDGADGVHRRYRDRPFPGSYR